MMKIKIFHPQPSVTYVEFSCPRCGYIYARKHPSNMRCVSCKEMIPNPQYLIDFEHTRTAFHKGML